MFYLDLDELERIEKNIWFFSRNKFNFFNFKDSDHLPFSSKPLKEKVKDYLIQNGVAWTEGRIMLLTHLRTLGYVFNPVSFYFCFDRDDFPVCAIAEVGNTFREIKPFLILNSNAHPPLRHTEKKHFYVSPFLDMDLEFAFNLCVPNEKLEIQINTISSNSKTPILLASLTGKKTGLNNLNLLKFILKYPLITLKVVFLIHWNAWILYFKRIHYYKKKDHQELQQGSLTLP